MCGGLTAMKRTKIYKVRLSEDEVQQIKDANITNIAKFLRDTALTTINAPTSQKPLPQYSKIDRDFILELSRIGGNLNQIAKAINTDLANARPIEAVRLLHLLIAIHESLNGLRQ